ncbi:unnamed protein product [Heterosigma akashiwo]
MKRHSPDGKKLHAPVTAEKRSAKLEKFLGCSVAPRGGGAAGRPPPSPPSATTAWACCWTRRSGRKHVQKLTLNWCGDERDR